MTLAIFDIDGTLVQGSTERRFWRFLLKRGRQGPRQLLAYAYFLLRYWPVYGANVAKKNKAYLAWLPSADVAALAAEFVATEVIPRLYLPTVRRLKQHLRRGDAVVLLSGTLEPIATALARELGVTQVRATRCVERAGRYTAAPPTVHPFAAAKVAAAAAVAADLGTDLSHASAYADSAHDLDLLLAVATPVAVLPDHALSIAAVANDWEIVADTAEPRALPH
jgi:HAD superfamily hydrolase (TIGR01490 family)